MGEDCDEGDIADGYSYLAYVEGSIFFVLFLVIPCLGLRLKRECGYVSWRSSDGHSLPLCFCIFLALLVGFYAYFITLIVYQVSTGEHVTKEVNAVFSAEEVSRWEFSNGLRVLVILDVFMIMRHFSFFPHIVECVSGSAVAHWFIIAIARDNFRFIERFSSYSVTIWAQCCLPLSSCRSRVFHVSSSHACGRSFGTLASGKRPSASVAIPASSN
jgi:hypothetical protein